MAAAAAIIVLGGSAIGWEAMRTEEGPTAAPTLPAPAPSVVSLEPVTADEFIARGVRRLEADPNGAFLDFDSAFKLRRDGRTAALMGYARSKAHSSPDARRFYALAIDQFGYRPAWVLNNRACEIIKTCRAESAQLAQALDDAEAALGLDPDLLAARYNRARARYFSRLDQTWFLNDERILDLIEQDLAAVLAQHPDAMNLHMLFAEVLVAPAWADSDRLERASEHVVSAVALGRPAKTVTGGPILRRVTAHPGLGARLDPPPPPRQPEPIDPGLADPPAL
jgi:hypothetical protein